MKISIKFLKDSSAVAKFEDRTYTYARKYEDMKLLAEDYYNIVANRLDGSQLAYWKNNTPWEWDRFNDSECNCIHEEEACGSAIVELDKEYGKNVSQFLDNLDKLSEEEM